MPETMDEIMLIQPNNITFGQYAISEVQENILTLIIDAIQDYVTNKKELPRDLFNQPYVEIVCDEAKGSNSKGQVKKAVQDMFKKEFAFNWVHPEIHKTVETTGTIVYNMHDIKGSNRIVINFNLWAVPFLLYFGVGVGGTRFSKTIALKLRGNYTKRIYKIISRWKDKTHFEYRISDFRKDLNISESYDNSAIKKKILSVSKERIQESGSDIWFDYKFVCKHPVKGRKPKDDTIIFEIKTLHPQKAGGKQYEVYSYVYSWMSTCFNAFKSSKALDVTEKLTELGELKTVHDRACYYDDKISTGEMTTEHAKNALKKMLREQFNIK